MNKRLNSPDEYRGAFISTFGKLEMAIDLYLAKYFFKNDGLAIDELIEVLIDRIPFEHKRTALKNLIDKKDNEDFKNGLHGNKKINHNKLIDKIGQLARVRNTFAHYPTANFSNFSEIEFGFTHFRDSRDYITYTLKEFYEIIDQIESCRRDINDLITQ